MSTLMKKVKYLSENHKRLYFGGIIAVRLVSDILGYAYDKKGEPTRVLPGSWGAHRRSAAWPSTS